ncbi:hypothetical protein NDA16_001482 [Ustilago loliicola]|nr:hypothetical protein NDA16_001482 [Ustilago loliicola]
MLLYDLRERILELAADAEALQREVDAVVEQDHAMFGDTQRLIWTRMERDIPEGFVMWYRTLYKDEFPERCNTDLNDPWKMMNCSPLSIDEIFNRITCFLIFMLEIEPDEPGYHQVDKFTFSTWADILFLSCHRALACKDDEVGRLYTGWPELGEDSLCLRLMNWAEQVMEDRGLIE